MTDANQSAMQYPESNLKLRFLIPHWHGVGEGNTMQALLEINWKSLSHAQTTEEAARKISPQAVQERPFLTAYTI